MSETPPKQPDSSWETGNFLSPEEIEALLRSLDSNAESKPGKKPAKEPDANPDSEHVLFGEGEVNSATEEERTMLGSEHKDVFGEGERPPVNIETKKAGDYKLAEEDAPPSSPENPEPAEPAEPAKPEEDIIPLDKAAVTARESEAIKKEEGLDLGPDDMISLDNPEEAPAGDVESGKTGDAPKTESVSEPAKPEEFIPLTEEELKRFEETGDSTEEKPKDNEMGEPSSEMGFAKSLEEIQREAEEKFENAIREGRMPKRDEYVEMRENDSRMFGSQEWRNKTYQRLYGQAYLKLTEPQRKEFDSLKFNHNVLSVAQAEQMLASGHGLEEIKKIGYTHWWSKKISSGLSKDPVLAGDFNNLVWKETEKKLKEEARKEIGNVWDVRKQKIIEEEVKAELEKQRAEQEKIWKREDRRRAKEAERQAKIEAAKNMPEDEKMTHFQNLAGKMREANLRNRKIVEIETALAAGSKTGEYKVRGERGLNAEEAKQKMEEFKASLVAKNAELSDEIIGIAEILTGKNLRQEALKATGYNPDYKGAKTDLHQEAKKDFQTYLTDEVKKILESHAVELHNLANKKKIEKWIEDLPAVEKKQPEKHEKSKIPLVGEASRTEKKGIEKKKKLLSLAEQRGGKRKRLKYPLRERRKKTKGDKRVRV